MATVVLTFPDAQQNRIINGIAGQHGYQTTVPAPNPLDPPVPNPETKAQFVKRMFIRFAKESVKAFEASQASNTARDTAVTDVETNITIT